jgi:hypothetical protein
MQGKQFIYFLFDENNNSYYQYGDTVLLSASLKPLEFTPDGWKKIQIQNQRNGTYFAIDRSFTLPLEYVKDGAQILKHIYYNYGVEAKVYMSICEQRLYFDATHYGFYYTLLYRGEIDLAQLKHDGTKVTVNIMEGGIVKFIKAYENTKYEIPVDVPDAVEVLMDGVELRQSSSYLLNNGNLPNDRGWHIIDLELLNTEAVSALGATSQERQYTSNATSNLWNIGQRFLVSGTNTVTVTLNWDFNVFVRLASGFGAIFGTSIFLQCHVLLDANTRYDIPGVPLGANIDSKGGGDPLLLYNRTHNFKGAVTFSAPANARFVLFMSANNNTVDYTEWTYENDGEFSVSYTYTHPSTTIKALRPLYVFQQLISKISDGAYTAQSAYLQSIQDVVVTCGDAIRGLTGAKIKTSLRDFFTSYNSDFGIGMGMLGADFRLEEKAYWVQYTDFIDLGEVSKMKVSPASDLLVNNIKVGTPDQEYDDVNGKQEFNTTHEYSAPITRVAKELNLVSVYRNDCYGIEFTRLNLDGKDTTDNDSDNDVFKIHIEDNPRVDGFYHLDRSLNVGATGLLSAPTVFNMYLTPARAVRRNGNYIRSLFYKLDSKYLKFQTTDKNSAVVAGGITENADIQIATLDAPLFSCNYLEFETKVPVDILELLKANPLKAFAGTWAGFSFVGIPDKVSVQPGDNGAQTFKLLAGPAVDLTQLISIDG